MVGRTLGHYEILEPLGAGGMGEVYRARDKKLDRDVAIKVLPDDFATDQDRLARFEREAKLLASLNHTNIAAIYGLEDEGDQRFIVMEVVEGETLTERLARSGRIEVDETLQIVRQIAEALEAAHENGVIHRDLKPANIKVTPEGKVKVLDFGLAKAYEADGSTSGISPDLSHSPTVMGATRTGVIMGTAAYMSPEQARGTPVDKRADNWAFGCVLYEMLTGKRAFDGETVSDTMAAILKEEPDESALPDEAHPTLRRLIGRCLEKDPRRRLRDIGDGRNELDEILESPADAGPAGDPALAAPRSRGGVTPTHYGAIAAVVALAAALAFWVGTAQLPDAPGAETTRSVIRLPEGQRQPRLMQAPLALSPDGTALAYVARDESGVNHLFLRRLDSFDTQKIEGSQHAASPFFSADGQWVGFAAAGKLKKVAIAGGAPIEITSISGAQGAAWGPEGTIIFARGLNTGLWSVPEAGGDAIQLTQPDFAENGYAHVWPQYLPGGRHILFQMWGDTTGPHVMDLETLERHAILDTPHPGGGLYLGSGHYGSSATRGSGAFSVQPFDLDALVVAQPAVPILDDVRYYDSQSAYPYFAASETGTVVYVSQKVDEADLMWIDRDGVPTTILTDDRVIAGIEISPDGRKAVFHDEQGNLFTMDFDRGAAIDSLTRTPAFHATTPVWNPDGRHVTLSSNVEGTWDIYEVDISEPGEPQPLLVRDYGQFPAGWSADGQLLVYTENDPETGFDVWILPRGEEPIPVLTSEDDEFDPVLSSDGRLLAYVSTGGGRYDVLVMSYPEKEVRGASTAGGEMPVWSADGHELFFRQGDLMMSVNVTLEPEFSVSTPEPLFELPIDGNSLGWAGASYDVAHDGRFLAVSDRSTTEFILITNWFEELKRLAPIAR